MLTWPKCNVWLIDQTGTIKRPEEKSLQSLLLRLNILSMSQPKIPSNRIIAPNMSKIRIIYKQLNKKKLPKTVKGLSFL